MRDKHNRFISKDAYETMYQQSLNDPESFWADMARLYLLFDKPYDSISNFDFKNLTWFEGGELNASVHCIDRHLKTRKDQVAIFWQGDEPDSKKSLTYQALYEEVCQMANVLKDMGVKKGDRICIYLPMLIEAPIAMLACARIGAIHSVVFAGFSSKALASRIQDSTCKVLISSNIGKRAGKPLKLQEKVKEAVNECPSIEHVLSVSDKTQHFNDARFKCYQTLKASAQKDCPPTVMKSEDPLFILYTSGSTGKPKGVVHTTAGYLLYTQMTFQALFGYQEGDVFFCGADVGWITGHSYIVYGPLASGATEVVFEGVPNYPNASRYWQLVDEYKINILYTAPTAVRSLMGAGDEWLEGSSRSSLKVLGSVGEPINPEVWQWYYDKVGQGRCPIIDSWWQTETGGIMVAPMPEVSALKPGFAQKPFFGIAPVLIDENQKEVVEQGLLAIKQPWPGMMRTLYNDKERYQSYFAGNYYLTGDGAYIDSEGDIKITGRLDDVLNISGHRLGTAEIESAILTCEKCREAAVVGMPHSIKGQGIYVFVSLKANVHASDELKAEIIKAVRDDLSPIATPDVIHFTDDLPKTRSGKIMRRILRALANKAFDTLGDVSTLANKEVVEQLIKECQES